MFGRYNTMVSPAPGPVIIIASTMCRWSLVIINLVPLQSFGASRFLNRMTGNPTSVGGGGLACRRGCMR